ncbi:formylglycine-generating enzyme family protein [Alphaproteobacteria bacterium]|nr:formylglycine-generating enzyme family protein [Alphaproteobacteria bacterium]
MFDKHLMISNRAKAMKSGFSYSLPTLGLLSILMLPLAGCDNSMEPGAVFKDCETCPEMVVIPAGLFGMGDMSGEGDSDEKPVHEVRIGYSFAVGKYEVTQAEWEAVMGKNPSEFKGAKRPVEKVSWEDAKSFVKKLSEQTGKEYRLLSESEWEYMARAGSTTKYPWGDEIDSSKAKYESKDGSEESTVPVGSYSANAFGVYDTAGNVSEWVEDCWHKNYKDAPTDGSAWTSGGDCSKRFLRGGSWINFPGDLRSANRGRVDATKRYYNLGFRIARTLAQ